MAQAHDSLHIAKMIEASTHAADAQKLKIYDEVAWLSRRTNPALALEYTERGIELAQFLGDSNFIYRFIFNHGLLKSEKEQFREGDSLMNLSLVFFENKNAEIWKAEMMAYMGHSFSRQGNYGEADSLLHIAYALSKKINYQKGKIAALQHLGINYIYGKKIEEAGRVLTQARDISDAEKIAKFLPAIYMNLGIVQRNKGEYAAAIKEYLKALELTEEKPLKAKIYTNLGSVYRNIDELEKALEYYEESLRLKEELADSRGMVYSLVNMGSVYSAKKDYGSAIGMYEKSIEKMEGLKGMENNMGLVLTNMGNVYNNMNQFEKAETYYERGLEIFAQSNNKRGISLANYNIAFLKKNMGQYGKAIFYAEKSLAMAEEINYRKIRMKNMEVMAEAYEEMGRHGMALTYFKLYAELKDSLFNEEKTREITEAENSFIKRQSEKDAVLKEEKINLLEKEKELYRLRIYGLLLGLGLLAAGAGAVITKQRKLIQVEKEFSREKAENEKLKNELFAQQMAAQKQQLEYYLKKISDRAMMLDELKKNLGSPTYPAIDPVTAADLPKFLNERLGVENDWQNFEFYFSKIHPDFFKNLKTACPEITANELNLCAFLKLNLVNKEIAQILGIGPESVRKATHRLAKKMGLPGNEALRDFIIKY